MLRVRHPRGRLRHGFDSGRASPAVTTRSIAGALAVAALASMAGCGSRGGTGTLGEVGTYDRDASGSFLGGDASTSGPLDASIEENHVAVKIVTLSCAGDCVDVVAVATGGHPPYTFAWDDGSSSASRQVCPTSSTSYHVKVTDTGVAGELAQPAETVQVPLTANVIACPDAGTGGISDAGTGGLCIANPSFEGMPATDDTSTHVAPSWDGCKPFDTGGFAGIEPSFTAQTVGLCTYFPAASDGADYLFFIADSPAPSVWQLLCEPLHAGTTYHLLIDLASNINSCGAVAASLAILGTTSSCAPGNLLWSSPLTSGSWQTYCATFTPTQETPYLGLGPVALPDAGEFAELLVDHIVPVAACP
jgi:hypothetical protein